MKPKQIRSWGDLRHWGIDILTGESCALSMRVLCDLSPEGIKLMSDFLGIQIQPGNAWNGGGDYASILLTNGMFEDLAAFCLVQGLMDGERVVVANLRGQGYTSEFIQVMTDDDYHRYREIQQKLEPNGYIRTYGNPGKGLHMRNTHWFSGRTV